MIIFVWKKKKKKVFASEMKNSVTEYFIKKTELCIANINTENYNFNINNIKIDDSDINKLKSRFDNIKREILLLNESLYNSYFNINIKKDYKYNICPLPYYINNLNKYEDYNKSILEKIKELINNGYKVAPIYINFEIELKYEDKEIIIECEDIDIDNDDEYYDYNYNKQKKKIYIHKDSDYIKCGKLMDHYSEYNDESGDNLHDKYKCACLVIFI